MTTESAFIARLRALATHPAARGLLDDAAVLPAPLGRDLVLTHDMLVEGVHFFSEDPPGDVLLLGRELGHRALEMLLDDVARTSERLDGRCPQRRRSALMLLVPETLETVLQLLDLSGDFGIVAARKRVPKLGAALGRADRGPAVEALASLV